MNDYYISRQEVKKIISAYIDHRITAGEMFMKVCDLPTVTLNFEWFRDKYCSHQSGSIRFGDDEHFSQGCTFKNEQSANCWDDWQKCNEQNCPFMKGLKNEKE